jgi:hypothetical protein
MSWLTTRLNKGIAFGARYIDYGMAWKGALFLGLVVFGINLAHGPMAALPAAIKQATYTFFIAGFIVKLCKTLVDSPSLGIMALPFATLIPSSIAIGLTYAVHSLKGTPEPFYSTLPTLIMAPLAFFVLARRQQHSSNSPSLPESL